MSVRRLKKPAAERPPRKSRAMQVRANRWKVRRPWQDRQMLFITIVAPRRIALSATRARR
jgi:hypothetical protein